MWTTLPNGSNGAATTWMFLAPCQILPFSREEMSPDVLSAASQMIPMIAANEEVDGRENGRGRESDHRSALTSLFGPTRHSSALLRSTRSTLALATRTRPNKIRKGTEKNLHNGPVCGVATGRSTGLH